MAKQFLSFSVSDLEHMFADDFKSPIFLILAQRYFENRDYSRAKKVCQIGLRHDPYNVLGRLLLSKIYFCIGKLIAAEKILIELVLNNPNLVNALRLLVEIQTQLKRDAKASKQHKVALSAFFPDNDNYTSAKEAPKRQSSKNKKDLKKSVPSQEHKCYEVDSNMATFAFYRIVKAQKQYQYANAILACIEKKSGTSPKINEEKRVLKSLIEN